MHFFNLGDKTKEIITTKSVTQDPTTCMRIFLVEFDPILCTKIIFNIRLLFTVLNVSFSTNLDPEG